MPESPAEFLARMIDRDEAVARAAADDEHGGPHWHVGVLDGSGFRRVKVSRSTAVVTASIRAADADHIATWDPARALAWCATVRELLSVHCQVRPGWCATCDIPGDVRGNVHGCLTVRALLRPYAGEPGFNPTWLED